MYYAIITKLTCEAKDPVSRTKVTGNLWTAIIITSMAKRDTFVFNRNAIFLSNMNSLLHIILLNHFLTHHRENSVIKF